MDDVQVNVSFRTIEMAGRGEKMQFEIEQGPARPASIPPTPAKRRASTEYRQGKV